MKSIVDDNTLDNKSFAEMEFLFYNLGDYDPYCPTKQPVKLFQFHVGKLPHRCNVTYQLIQTFIGPTLLLIIFGSFIIPFFCVGLCSEPLDIFQLY